MHLDDYGIVNCLAEYYQMESRWSIKMIILKTLDSLCILSRTAIVILLGTVLPLELARLKLFIFYNYYYLILLIFLSVS